jgi:DNA mismatch repair protein MutS2
LVSIAGILERSGPDTLVLLDELAAGTDPEEGAALATAVLEAFVERGTAVVVTTHYERLKEVATEDKARFENASVGFDFERMAPTFKLLSGIPGPSSALAVALRFGLDQSIVSRAKTLMPEQALQRETLMKKLETERIALERERQTLQGELERHAELKAELEAAIERVEARETSELKRETRALIELVQKARVDVRDARKRLRETTEAGELRELERTVNRAAEHVAIGGPAQRNPDAAETREKPVADALVPGTAVRLKHAGKTAIVEAAPDRGQVRLRVGGLKLVMSVSEIEAVTTAPARPASKPKKSRSGPRTLATPMRTTDNTLDLRGERVDDVASRIDGLIDRMLGEGHPVGFVLHGHGTGALKAAVREYLHTSSYVERARAAEPDEGGDAFTVFWIKE